MATDETKHTLVVPTDFEFLDPDRPEVVYEKDMTPEDRERFASEMEATKTRAAKSSVKPPYGINLPGGRRITSADMRDPSTKPGEDG
jgi:hypothetical protein